MKTRIKLYYYWDMASYLPAEDQKVEITSHPHSKEYWPNHIMLQEIEIDVPDMDRPADDFLAASMIKSLEEQNQKIQAEAFIKVEANNDKIRQLQRLTIIAGEVC